MPGAGYGLRNQRKKYVDSSVDFNRISIEESGLIAPLFNSVNGSRHEIGWAADYRDLGDQSVGSKDDVKSDGALDTIMFRTLRINRLDFVDKPRNLHVSADFDAHRRGVTERK